MNPFGSIKAIELLEDNDMYLKSQKGYQCGIHLMWSIMITSIFVPVICFSATQQLTDNDKNDTNPSVYNGTVAWQSNLDGDSDIYYWDGETTIKVTDNTTEDVHPSLYNGPIAWV